MIITLAYSMHNNPSIVVYFTIKLRIFDFLILFFSILSYFALHKRYTSRSKLHDTTIADNTIAYLL